jgi:transposase
VLGELFFLDGKQLQAQYLLHLSDYTEWFQKSHCEQWLVFPENIGTHLSIDETSLSQGELYTIISNKAAKGKKGSLVAMVKGTVSDEVIAVLEQICEKQRAKVKEITVDLAPTMHRIARRCFPKSSIVSDRFHVQKLAMDAVQELRIQYRWEAIELENTERQLAKETNQKYIPHVLENGDTLKQLLARSRYLLFKSRDKWTPRQHHRAELLFERYPILELAYNLSRKLSSIFSKSMTKQVAYKKLALWFNEVEMTGLKSFSKIADTIYHNYDTILNFFTNRSTNAGAESFNAKIKALRRQFRGVSNIPFFLYRLAKLYA